MWREIATHKKRGKKATSHAQHEHNMNNIIITDNMYTFDNIKS